MLVLYCNSVWKLLQVVPHNHFPPAFQSAPINFLTTSSTGQLCSALCQLSTRYAHKVIILYPTWQEPSSHCKRQAKKQGPHDAKSPLHPNPNGLLILAFGVCIFALFSSIAAGGQTPWDVCNQKKSLRGKKIVWP